MKLASLTATGRGATDQLLSEAAILVAGQGLRTAGIVKALNYAPSYGNGCDMAVTVLPDGPEIRITQSLGEGSDACRLDPGAIANAVSAVESAPLEGTDLFILNKFGPEEAAGRGFCAVIGKALEQGVPVLVGVGAGNLEAFEAFAGGLATRLEPDLQSIQTWLKSVDQDTA
jgi:phosphohistidine swiveling domain-containing protein